MSSMRETRLQELEDLQEMFMSPGWKIVQRDMTEMLEKLIVNGWDLETGDALLRNAGEVRAYRALLNLPDRVELEHDNFEKLTFADEQTDTGNPLED